MRAIARCLKLGAVVAAAAGLSVARLVAAGGEKNGPRGGRGWRVGREAGAQQLPLLGKVHSCLIDCLLALRFLLTQVLYRSHPHYRLFPPTFHFV